MKLLRKPGSTSEIWQIFIRDSSSTTGAGLTGLTNASAGLTAYYHRDTDTTATAISLVTMTVGTFTSSGFKEVDSTNMPGLYQFCPPNAALASGAKSCAFLLKGATNMAPLPIEVDLLGQVDVELWNGTAVPAPATAGIPDVNAKAINNVATTSVTTINANVGTTQPQNFTGAGASALVKSDTVDVAGASVTPGCIPNAVAGAAGGLLIAGTNAATTINGLTLTGAAASGSTPAAAGLTVTGGAASTTGGGTAAAGIVATGGAGAATTNGAAAGVSFTAGGTTTVSGNDGFVVTATGNGNGLTAAHAGTGKDLNAQTTNALQVNATAINAVSTSSVTTVNANVGTTQPANFTGTGASALVKSDMVDIAGAAVSTSTAQIGVNVIQSAGTTIHNSDGTLASATASTVTFPTTDSAGNTIPDDTRFQYTSIQIVAGTGIGQIVALTTKNGVRAFNIQSGTCPVQLDATSQYIVLPTWRSEVDLINGIATSNVTTINANVGTTQPTNFTGTGGSALVKGDAVDIGGTAAASATVGTVTNLTNAAAITSNIKKNQALAAFEFLMTDSTTHAPKTGLTVTCTRSIDGGAFAAGTLANVLEIGSGIYKVDFGAGDLNGNVITLHATATGADDTYERVVTQP